VARSSGSFGTVLLNKINFGTSKTRKTMKVFEVEIDEEK